MLEKTEGAIKNGQSRDNGNIGYARHRTKTRKAKTQHRKLKRGAIQIPPNTRMNPCDSEWKAVPASRDTLHVIHIV
jgi:hypothetical protein